MWQFCLLMFLSFILFSHFLVVEKNTPSSQVLTFFFWFTEHWPQPLALFCVIFFFHRRLIKYCWCRCFFLNCILFSFLIATNYTFRIYRVGEVCCLAYRIYVYITIQNLCFSQLNFLFFFDNFDTKIKTKARNIINTKMDRERDWTCYFWFK